jgi:hypothetical protein
MFSPPKVQTPPPPPTVDQARVDAEQSDYLLKRNGRQSTFVSTPLGRGQGASANKPLLGQG